VDCNVFWTFVVTMLLNTKSRLIVTKQVVLVFAPKNYIQPAPSNVFLNGVRVQLCNQVKYVGALLNASLKDYDDIQRQVKSLYCAANKLRGPFDQCSPAVKTLYFVPIALQCMLASCGANTHRLVWSAYALHTTVPTELRIPRNVSVRPHRVKHCINTFDALLRNNLYRFFKRYISSSNFFIRSLQMSDAFYKSSFFRNYLTLVYDRDQLK